MRVCMCVFIVFALGAQNIWIVCVGGAEGVS